MNYARPTSRRSSSLLTLMVAALLIPLSSGGQKTPNPKADPAPVQVNPEADKAWQILQSSQQDMQIKLADAARHFHTLFPKDDRAEEAQAAEQEALEIAAALGSDAARKRLDALEKALLDDPKLDADERFEIRVQQVVKTAQAKVEQSRDAAFQELEAGARQLLKEFPGRPEPFQMLLQVAGNLPDGGRPILEEIIKSPAPDAVKEQASGVIKRLDAVGKSIDLKFTALDGRAVGFEKMRGKVVLVDFWATWCGPCVVELPNVKAAFEKLHPKGFEIVGISFDEEKAELEKFVKAQKLPWPQFFDGKGWENRFGVEFGIKSIPAMWLVDKKGVLRDVSAREDLEAKVTKLLAE